MEFILWLIMSTIAVFVTSEILSGVHVNNWTTALVVAVVLGVLNAFIKPILLILTLPINILTLGLFTFVIMAAMVLLATAIIPGFTVDGFWWALAFAVIMMLVNWFLEGLRNPY